MNVGLTWAFDGGDGFKVASVAVEGLPSDSVCVKAWKYLLQGNVGEEQAIHSGASNCGEMQRAVKAIVLHQTC